MLAAAPWLVLAIICVALAASGAWVAAFPALLMAGGAGSQWRRCGTLDHPRAVIRLLTRGPQLFAGTGDGTEEAVACSSDSRVGGACLVLCLRGTRTGRRYTVVLVPASRGGNAGADALRRLRVWLRLMPALPAPIESTAWYRNFPQRFWPGDKTHEH